jgi:DNA-binding MarR family transcriptional regulator
MSRGSEKQRWITELGEQFRINGINDLAFDQVTADRLGINRTDLNCLDVIERHGGVTAGQLATEAGLTTGAVTAVVDRLEKQGYVRRIRDDEDRRRVKLETTADFIKEAERIWAPLVEEWNELMRRATISELKSMVDFMREANEVKPRHIERVRRGE